MAERGNPCRMPRTRTLVLVLAGGAGGRLELLTHRRAKPAVSFAGTHRLIDFPLSNCLNAGIGDVWVAQQYNPLSLSDHLANGRAWDLDRTHGRPGRAAPERGQRGRRRASSRAPRRSCTPTRARSASSGPAALVVVSADAVYKLDYGALVDEHMRDGCRRHHGDHGGRAGRRRPLRRRPGRRRPASATTSTSPTSPTGNLVSNEVFVFRPEALLDVLEELAAGRRRSSDLGHAALPRLVDAGNAREHRFVDYWRDVGTIPAYWQAHRELTGDEPPIDLDDPAWPVLTHATSHRASAQVLAGAALDRGAAGARLARRRERGAQRDRPRRGGGGRRHGPRRGRAPRRGGARGGDGRVRGGRPGRRRARATSARRAARSRSSGSRRPSRSRCRPAAATRRSDDDQR